MVYFLLSSGQPLAKFLETSECRKKSNATTPSAGNGSRQEVRQDVPKLAVKEPIPEKSVIYGTTLKPDYTRI